ncbi:pyridoxamine 5'-phosphate oxidase family protein [Metabacillus arenae]|uniref:Pyridoxamine 5'-phosphate oxidase family protein n=1 Tax=Metabacillus arenae TaxID=2771434 RepID=A0A926NHL4_9BACI|nr:pyridoxamine 5'-phosphate oxidase family protein [Metabacillus arenae]MBD1380940.1 pyridoxamine 5'-phosphate oxidase family protein [Metabacillus arenae]
MANKVETSLIEPLYQALQKERFVTVATVDHETGGPNVTSISWVYAPDTERVYFAIDLRSRIVENIKKHPSTVINVIANESTYSIIGNAHLKIEKLDEVPLKLALIEVNISEVRDVMFYGSKISVDPQYEKTYDERAAAKLDQQVLSAMKKA